MPGNGVVVSGVDGGEDVVVGLAGGIHSADVGGEEVGEAELGWVGG